MADIPVYCEILLVKTEKVSNEILAYHNKYGYQIIFIDKNILVNPNYTTVSISGTSVIADGETILDKKMNDTDISEELYPKLFAAVSYTGKECNDDILTVKQLIEKTKHTIEIIYDYEALKNTKHEIIYDIISAHKRTHAPMHVTFTRFW